MKLLLIQRLNLVKIGKMKYIEYVLKREHLRHQLKKELKNYKTLKKRIIRKHTFLVLTDVPITSNDPMDILGNPNVSTILPLQIKTLILTLQIPKLFGMNIPMT